SHVKEHDIECEWSPVGHLTAVVSAKREKKVRDTAEMLQASGEEFEWYDRDAVERVTGSRHYHAAVLTPRSVLMNPAALCRRLGETMPENVEVCEETAVLGIKSGSPIEIACAEGS
ncbi:MAG: FAD-binding oxidoreductase, partial [Gammaproteobacteria bacterium]|nr:FAD-binding oxidoreductase [Gammaproteobacteria bacterium]